MPGLSSPPVTSASHGIGPGIPPPPPPSSAPFSPQHIAGFSPPSLFSRYVPFDDYLSAYDTFVNFYVQSL